MTLNAVSTDKHEIPNYKTHKLMEQSHHDTGAHTVPVGMSSSQHHTHVVILINNRTRTT